MGQGKECEESIEESISCAWKTYQVREIYSEGAKHVCYSTGCPVPAVSKILMQGRASAWVIGTDCNESLQNYLLSKQSKHTSPSLLTLPCNIRICNLSRRSSCNKALETCSRKAWSTGCLKLLRNHRGIRSIGDCKIGDQDYYERSKTYSDKY